MTQKDTEQAKMFSNRLLKQYRILRKWARRERITCYRLYDRDIPEIPLACDIYTFVPEGSEDKLSAILAINEENAILSANGKAAAVTEQERSERTYLHMYLYERPYEKPEEEEEEWLSLMAKSAAECLGIRESHVITKTRKRQSADRDGKKSQYERLQGEHRVTGTAFEQGQIFLVNLTQYIDTGLFFDHRPLRNTVRSECRGKRVLNLYCYTGSFSVYAAEGGATSVESVDMSNTYLDWAKRNMALNGFTSPDRYSFTRSDTEAFLDSSAGREYDIIILDPPTFSNSKKTEHTLDINRDWPRLVEKCLARLSSEGVLYFSTNSRRLSFSEEKLPRAKDGSLLWKSEDITQKTIPEDFRSSKIHKAWKITARN